MTGAARNRSYRQRLKEGRLSLRIDVDELGWPAKLVALGKLALADCEDRQAIARATIALIDSLVVVELGP